MTGLIFLNLKREFVMPSIEENFEGVSSKAGHDYNTIKSTLMKFFHREGLDKNAMLYTLRILLQFIKANIFFSYVKDT